jgi:hypothetical protein
VLALSAIIVGILLFAIYITAIRSTNRRVGEYGGIIRRQLFSYIQVSDSSVLLFSLSLSLSLSLPSHNLFSTLRIAPTRKMLGVLGIFKARGTRVFNKTISESSRVAGGSVISATGT